MVIIRQMRENDYEGKGYVHYKSWHETYTGLIAQSYLNTISLEICIDIAKRYPENTYVAVVDDKVVGFACYGQYRDDDLINAGEVYALYVLKDYQKQGIGKLLMNTCLEELKDFKKIVVWVLSTNDNAISFYKHMGFETDV